MCGFNSDETVISGIGPKTAPEGGIIIASLSSNVAAISMNATLSTADADVSLLRDEFYIAATPSSAAIYDLVGDSKYLNHCTQTVIKSKKYSMLMFIHYPGQYSIRGYLLG